VKKREVEMADNCAKILVVDDEPDVLDFLGTLLEDNGYRVVTAKNGKEALEKARQEKPDLITLDISMPEESGVRALKNLQESEETRDIPIMILTGVSKDFRKFIHTRKAVKPPTDYMEKPIDRDVFLDKMKKMLAAA